MVARLIRSALVCHMSLCSRTSESWARRRAATCFRSATCASRVATSPGGYCCVAPSSFVTEFAFTTLALSLQRCAALKPWPFEKSLGRRLLAAPLFLSGRQENTLPLSPAAHPKSHMRAYQCYKYQHGNRRHNLINQHLVYLRMVQCVFLMNKNLIGPRLTITEFGLT